VLADTWDCNKCPRGDDYRCPIKHETNREELLETVLDSQEGDIPLVFVSDMLAICPRCLVTDWGGYIWQAYQWQESGGDLGVPFTDCPKWLLDAFNLLATERSKANKYKFERDKKK